MSTSRRLIAAAVLAASAIGTALAFPAPASASPSNDNFQFAQFLPGDNRVVSGTNIGATDEIFEQQHGLQTPRASIWYRWTAPASGKAIFRTFGTSFDTTMSAYTGATLQTLHSVAESDDTILADGTRVPQSQVVFDAVKGTEYRVAIDGFLGATGTIKLTYTVNDTFAAALPLTGASGGFGVDLSGATAEAGEPAHAGSPANASVWYSWTAPSNGIATFFTTQSAFDAKLAAYTGNSVNALTLVAQNDNQSSTNKRAQIKFAATAGTTYRIALDTAVATQQGFENVTFNLVDPKVNVGTGVSTAEGNTGTRTVNVGLSLNVAAPFPVTVKFATKDGSATAASGDYVAASGTVTFPAGTTVASIPLQVRGDTVKELNETFTVNLSSPSGGFGLGNSAATVTITNDDLG